MTEDTNGIDPDLARDGLLEDDEIQDEFLAKQMAYITSCKPLRERQKSNFKSMVERGMPKDAWRLTLAEHRIKRATARQISNLYKDEEDETVETVEMIREAIGVDFASLPLGDFGIKQSTASQKKDASAKGAAAPKGRGKGKDAETKTPPANDDGGDVRPAFLKSKETERVEENAKRLQDGIKPLDTDGKTPRPH